MGPDSGTWDSPVLTDRIRNHPAIGLALLAALLLCAPALAQTPLPELPTLPLFPLHPQQTPIISSDAVVSRPFSVVGPRGAVLGEQDGSYEAWLFPWKILSGVRISAQMENYAVPIDVNQQVAWIDVRPDSTTVTFSHANFTIREIILAPKHVPEGAGVAIFYQIEAVRPMTLTFSFDPNMQRMWPAESDDRPSPEWVKTGNASGFYILHLNFPDHAAGIAMPTAEPGVLPPYQERAKYYPLQFVLHFDPARDTQTLFPLLLSMGNSPAETTREAMASRLAQLDGDFRSIYEGNQKYYREFLNSHMSIETPDRQMNDAFSWAEVSIDQLRVETIPNHDEEALTAGFVVSGDAARPGFGWFFGRDALWSLYAVDSYGGFETTRQEMEFLLRRQSPEGKIIHEFSQTANLVDWRRLPYEYAAADATPLFLMAMNDYLRISGDVGYVAANWAGIARAWNFICTHDGNGDGIYDNSQGTGWVESWPGMPRQEIYMAVLDEQASLAYAHLALASGHSAAGQAADTRAAKISGLIEGEYFLPQKNFYAFSWNNKDSIDQTPTIFPSVAWWDGAYALDHKQSMFSRWASDEFSTDWGDRDISNHVSFYDPISYHQGSVWPLFTGWLSVAEYRTGHTLSAYLHLQQNAGLLWTQDLGNATELISGEFFQPLGRSTAHQLWSAAMIVSPVVRGLFGLEWDAEAHSLSVTPNLPAQWGEAKLHNVPLGKDHLDLELKRDGKTLVIRAAGAGASTVILKSQAPAAEFRNGTLTIPLPAVEVGVSSSLPEPGAETRQMKVLDQQSSPRSLTLRLSAPAGSSQNTFLRINDPKAKIHATGIELPGTTAAERNLPIQFPPGTGYVEKTITFNW